MAKQTQKMNPSPEDEPAAQSPPVAEPPVQVEPTAGVSGDDMMMGMLSHLLGIFTGWVGPLVIWLVKKDESPFVEAEAKESLNFQITAMIGWIVGMITTPICIGFVILPAVAVGVLVFCIIGATTANKGQPYRYPVCIRFFK